MRPVAALLLLALAGFCVFGFLASSEPMDDVDPLPWKLGYAAGGLTSLALALRLLASGRTR